MGGEGDCIYTGSTLVSELDKDVGDISTGNDLSHSASAEQPIIQFQWIA